MTTEPSLFFTARDELRALVGDMEARSDTSAPEVDDRFNWAHDVFDAIADGNDEIAVQVTGPDGAELTRSFAQLKERSDQVANWLLRTGLRRGDVALLMLDDRPELREVMLAALKIGVVILPASVALTPEELADRVERGQVRAVIAGPGGATKLADASGLALRIGVALDEGTKDQRALLWDWTRYEESSAASLAPISKRTTSDDPALLHVVPEASPEPEVVTLSIANYFDDPETAR